MAVQVTFAVIVTLPAGQLLDQPAKTEPEEGVAVKVTTVPLLRVFVQVVPQVIPEGLLVTVPKPERATVSVYVVVIGLNTAVQLMSALTVTIPVPQALLPVQPANVDPLAATAIRVTAVPLG